MYIQEFEREYPYNLYFAVFCEDIDLDEHQMFNNIMSTISPLSARNANIILSRYRDKKTLDFIGSMHGICKERTRQVIKESITKLRSTKSKYILMYGAEAYESRSFNDSDSIDILGLSTDACAPLARAGYDTIGKVKKLLSEHSKSEIIDNSNLPIHIQHFGSKRYDELVEKLAATEKP